MDKEADAIKLIDKEIDCDKTASEAKKLLTKDFDKYLNLSGIHRTDLSSPTLDPTGVSSHGTNHQEEKVIMGVIAERRVHAISDAINNCSNTIERPYAKFLYLRFVKRLSNTVIKERIGIEDTQLYRIQKRALVEFAQVLEAWKARDNATDLRSVLYWKD